MIGSRDLVPSLRAVDVARSESRGKAVTIGVEDEERVIADGLEVTVVGGLLLRAVDRALRTVDVEDHPPRGRSCRSVLDQCRVEKSESLIVTLLGEDVRLEPVKRRGERDTRLPPLARS